MFHHFVKVPHHPGKIAKHPDDDRMAAHGWCLRSGNFTRKMGSPWISFHFINNSWAFGGFTWIYLGLASKWWKNMEKHVSPWVRWHYYGSIQKIQLVCRPRQSTFVSCFITGSGFTNCNNTFLTSNGLVSGKIVR